jgi:MFS family permease
LLVLRGQGADAAVRRLALARLISFAGTQAAYVALIALIYQRSGGSGLWISAALIAGLGARVLSSPWAGSLADYFDRRLVMVMSDLAAAGCFIALSAVQSLPLLVALAAVAGIAEAPFSPASGGLLTMLVPERRRGWANGVLSMGSSGGTLVGAAGGGIVVASFGASTAFLINAFSFVVSAVLASSISGRFATAARHAPEHRGALKGIRFLLADRTLRPATFSVALLALGLGMSNLAELPLFVHLGAGNIGFGLAVAAWGGGQISGARLASHITDARLERLALITGGAVVAGAVGLSGTVPIFAAVALLFVLGGLGNAFLNISVVMMIQRWSPDQVRGRTIAAFEAVANTAIGISLIVGGLLLAPLSAPGVYLLAGGLGAIAVLISLRIPRHPNPVKPQEQMVEPPGKRTGNRLDLARPTPIATPA